MYHASLVAGKMNPIKFKVYMLVGQSPQRRFDTVKFDAGSGITRGIGKYNGFRMFILFPHQHRIFTIRFSLKRKTLGPTQFFTSLKKKIMHGRIFPGFFCLG